MAFPSPTLTPLELLSSHAPSVRVGAVQRSGAMALAPLFGPDAGERFVPPLSGLKLARVAGYGSVELECRGGVDGGVAIVPLHIGYIQDKAQNHALCRSALLGSGQKRMFEDACCVQQGQGGLLEGRDQWFFVLPMELREAALHLRGTKGFQKLWADIAKLNASLGLAARGHLEQIVCHERYYLTQYASRFEILPGQTGALFFVDEKLVGIELAPNAAYFREVWMPLVCFSYGVAAKSAEARSKARAEPALRASDLDGLRRALDERRSASTASIAAALARVPRGQAMMTEDERYLDLRLSTITSAAFVGQVVEDAGQADEADPRGRLVYLSLSATKEWLAAA